MSRSWEVRLAAALLGIYVLVGAGLVLFSIWMLTLDGGPLFVVFPAAIGAVAIAGIYICGTAVIHRSRLLRAVPGARIQAALLGVLLLMLGLLAMVIQPWVGLVMALQGIALVALMMTSAAATELGGWTSGGWR